MVARASWLITLCALGNLAGVLTGTVSIVISSGGRSNLFVELVDLPQVVIAAPIDSLANEAMTAFADVPLGVRLLAALPDVVIAVMLVVAAACVGRVLSEIGSDRSFGPEARRQLRRLSAILIGGSVAAAVLNAVAAAAISMVIDRLDQQGQGVMLTWVDIPALYLVLALLAAGLSWAFQDGAVLEKEAEGVV